ncbi:Mpp10 protein-domain-containing protein [Podospora appendiculata]|uniref:U3 small nucleolar ribonucleoprotein protein MPP10 n=1 Tax=Podospora appendiculata TaxID=314037 RepID=A0AAE0X0T5_9PEZI|nr:Mpp10 protein-domain-containing protein [Podospora appendiculata]
MAGTGSTSSSLTSTSHTLTHAPSMAPPAVTDGSPVAVFLDSISPTNRHVFIQPPPLLPSGSLQLAKETLDALAGQVSDQQQLRLRDAGKKRKRQGQDRTAVLKIRKLYTDGFETGQIWQQAKKIITSALDESLQVLDELEESGEVEEGTVDGAVPVRAVHFGEDGFEIGSDASDSASASSDVGSEADTEDSDDEGSEASADEDMESLGSEMEGVELDEDEDQEEEVEGEEEVREEGEDEDEVEDEDDESVAEYKQDPDGLNDGFFSLDDFNKQSQFFEAQDARADPNTDDFSDDESVDWHADPMEEPTGKSNTSGDGQDDEDEDDDDVDMDDDDDEEDVPSFKKAEGAAEEASDDEAEEAVTDGLDLDLDLTANDIFYKDFFTPPARKWEHGKKNNNHNNKKKPFGRQQDLKPVEEADIERAENDVKRDLFDDMSERSDSEDALSDVSAGNPKSRRSALERRQAKVAEEIRKLEGELVAKRAWTLSGEAMAADRPKNSLLEEDLDFEHVGKPVPIITEEVSESIEALIKRRILAQEFDEVLRRRPDGLGSGNTRRGLVDVDDTKGKQSLAEIYEEEHVKSKDPDAYVSQADEKVRKDEEEIKQMWADVCGKLDALSSWHYKPKPAAPTLTVVADVATINMEDAQPATAQGVAGGESMIAPQEVYAPTKETAGKGEVVAKSGLPVARQEMTREEKLRRRRREKERIRKAGGLDATKNMTKGQQARKETMADLKKGGVRVINRKGEMVGLDGKKATENKHVATSGSYKL